VRHRWVRAATVAALLATGACGDDGDDPSPPSTTRGTTTSDTTTTTTAPERQPSTTTTAFDPTSVEGQVEAAYLRSWDVYAEAVYNLELDEEALAEVYADPLIGVRRTEIERRVRDGHAALVRLEHNYQIDMTGPDTAAVIDRYVNHQVLIDPVTKQPTEEDPNETLVDVFSARLVNGSWLIFDQRRLE